MYAPSLVLTALVGCDAERYDSGASELMRVREATFHPGELPEDNTAEQPLVLNAAGVNYVVTQGQGSVVYNGLLSKDAYSVAVTFPTVSSGYWVVPAGGPDVTQDGNLVFLMTIDFTSEVPYGLQTLSFVAIDGDGNPGPRYDTLLCVLPESGAGSLAACDPEVTPPNAVISLSWDTAVDLDLVVVAPNGKVVSAKAPTTALAEGTIPSELVNAESTGSLSRDSNGGCVIDNIRRESLVFPGEPEPGEYLLYASLHSACGRSYVNYGLSLFQRVDEEDGTHPVIRDDLARGELVSLQADAGESLGTFVAALTLP